LSQWKVLFYASRTLMKFSITCMMGNVEITEFRGLAAWCQSGAAISESPF
jgi:hypothetical protein